MPKRADATRGDGVVVGASTTESRWSRAVADALNTPHVRGAVRTNSTAAGTWIENI